MTPDNWQIITDALAQTTISGTGAASHLEGIDFTGKTGTAQVVNHSAGTTSLGSGNERANAWFVGMAPRRNPDIIVAVLWEHGGWGAGSAPVAAQIVNAFVTKQRKHDGNLLRVDVPKPAPAPSPSGVPVASLIPAASTPN